MTQIQAIYLTDVTKTSHIAELSKDLNLKLTIISPWFPKSKFVKSLLKASSRITSIVSNRQNNTITGVRYKNIGPQQFLIPIIRHIFSRNSNRKIIEFVNRLTQLQFFIAFLRYDLVIVTDEVFPLLVKPRQKVLVEVRGNLPIAVKLRITNQLNSPLKAFESSASFSKNWKRILNRADGYLVYSDSTKQQLLMSGVPKQKIAVQPLRQIDSSQSTMFIQSNRIENSLLFVGRDGLLKGLDLAILVAKEMSLGLTTIGNFSPSTNSWLATFDFVTNLGSLPHSQVLKTMTRHKVVISPGIESFGYAILEALESGCKVVTTKYSGVTTWIKDNENLVLCKELSLDSLSQGVEIALQSPNSFKSNLKLVNSKQSQTWDKLIHGVINV